MLPVINRECVAQAVRTGLGLNAHINLVSRFDRKNYFYADLPAGYQISQFEHPIVGDGKIEIELADGSTKEIGITRLHLEQDAGKSLHDQHPTQVVYRSQPLRRGADGNRQRAGSAQPGGSRRLSAQAAHDPALSRHLRRQHGGRLHARRRERFGAQARRAVPHALRGEERELDALRHAGGGGRGEAADRGVGRRRDGPARRRGCTIARAARRAACAARKTRTITVISPIPTCCRWCWTRPGSTRCKAELAGIAGRQAGALRARYGLPLYDAGVLVAEQVIADFYETVAKGRDGKLAANWVIGDFFAGAEPHRRAPSRTARFPPRRSASCST